MTTTEQSAPLSQFARIWDLGLDVDAGASRPRQPARQVEWVYICMRKLIEIGRSIQCMLSTASDEIVESGQVYDVLFGDPDHPWMDFISETIGYVSLVREAYWIFAEPEGLAPRRIIVAGPDTCTPVIRRGVIVGYTLRGPDGQRIPLFVEDVHPLRDFNPYDAHAGLGPLHAGTLSISASYQASQFNESTLGNGGRIGGVLGVPAGVRLDDEERAKLRAEFRQRHAGARNAGHIFLATGGLTYTPITQTMVDLQMLDLRRFEASTICALFGVPPETVGLNTEAQYAHGPAHQRLIIDTVSPLLAYIAGHITIGILPRFRYKSVKAVPASASTVFCGVPLALGRRPGYRAAKLKAIQSGVRIFAWFDVDSHPIMQEATRERAAKMLEYTKSGVPLNQVIDAGDLPFERVPWGDDWWIPMGQVPARYIMEEGPESMLGPSLPEGQGEEPPAPPEEGQTEPDKRHKTAEPESLDIKRQLRIWRKWVLSWRPIEQAYKSALRTYFIRQRRQLAKSLEAALTVEGKDDQDRTDRIVARVRFDLRVEGGKIRVINRTFFERAARLGIEQTLTEIGGDTTADALRQVVATPAVQRAMAISSQRISKINDYTQQLVGRTLREGLDAGEGLNKLTDRLRQVLDANRARALRIARTQTAGAVNTGRHAGMRSAGVERKAWITSGDEAVRPAHRQAGIDYADGIPLDQPFAVGGESLMYPGDPAGSAANIVNCRCMQIARVANGKRLDDTHYDRLTFATERTD